MADKARKKLNEELIDKQMKLFPHSSTELCKKRQLIINHHGKIFILIYIINTIFR